MPSSNITQTATSEILLHQDGLMYNIYKLPKNFVIKGDLSLSELGLKKLPDLSTVTITGNFSCADNELTNLRGAPRSVGGNFDCSRNQIETLMHLPLHIGGGIDTSSNMLKNLNGSPSTVNGTFNCSSNQLLTLSGGPQIVKGNFDCSYNSLVSLQEGPQQVGSSGQNSYFDCAFNRLKSLDGAPKSKLAVFNCNNNLFDNESSAPPYISEYATITGLTKFQQISMINNYYSRGLRRGINSLLDKIQQRIEPVTKLTQNTLEGYLAKDDR